MQALVLACASPVAFIRPARAKYGEFQMVTDAIVCKNLFCGNEYELKLVENTIHGPGIPNTIKVPVKCPECGNMGNPTHRFPSNPHLPPEYLKRLRESRRAEASEGW